MVGDILQPTHLLFVLVVALLVLGPKRLPEVGRTLGNGLRDFRAAINGESPEKREELDSEPWHSQPEPDDKHEFAHDSEPTPDSHEFAHETSSVVEASPSEHATTEPAPAESPVAEPATSPSPPAATSDSAANPDKHEFAYESTESADHPAGPRD